MTDKLPDGQQNTKPAGARDDTTFSSDGRRRSPIIITNAYIPTHYYYYYYYYYYHFDLYLTSRIIKAHARDPIKLSSVHTKEE